MKIHPAAIVSPDAQIAEDVEIGPFCIVEAGVEISTGCRLAARASILSGTTLGRETVVSEGAVIGGLPQHTQAPEVVGRLVIGERNIIREHVTIHRALNEGQSTILGDDCMVMVGAHVAHDCQVGNHVILTNGTMLGGHVEIGDRVCVGGNSAIHQFCRVGRLAMVGASTKVTKDLPPFMLADGATASIVGLNKVGLRRSGMSREEVRSLKDAYQLIYREGLSFDATVAALQEQFTDGASAEYAEFFLSGKRGFIQERRSPPQVTLRVHADVDDVEAAEAVRLDRKSA